jgi:hypothetical protein
MGRKPLGAAMLTHQPAHAPVRSPVTLLHDKDSPAPAFRAKKFRSAKSLSMAFSSSATAKSFLIRPFSF